VFGLLSRLVKSFTRWWETIYGIITLLVFVVGVNYKSLHVVST